MKILDLFALNWTPPTLPPPLSLIFRTQLQAILGEKRFRCHTVLLHDLKGQLSYFEKLFLGAHWKGKGWY